MLEGEEEEDVAREVLEIAVVYISGAVDPGVPDMSVDQRKRVEQNQLRSAAAASRFLGTMSNFQCEMRKFSTKGGSTGAGTVTILTFETDRESGDRMLGGV